MKITYKLMYYMKHGNLNKTRMLISLYIRDSFDKWQENYDA